MKRSALSLHATRLAALMLAAGTVVSLSGCESLNDMLASDKVNYKETASAPPSAVPAGGAT